MHSYTNAQPCLVMHSYTSAAGLCIAHTPTRSVDGIVYQGHDGRVSITMHLISRVLLHLAVAVLWLPRKKHRVCILCYPITTIYYDIIHRERDTSESCVASAEPPRVELLVLEQALRALNERQPQLAQGLLEERLEWLRGGRRGSEG